MTAKTAVKATVKNPLGVSVLGAVAGLLTLAEGFFASGHFPAASQIASVIAGSGLTLGSVLGYVAHDLGLTKARLSHDASVAAQAAAQIAPALDAAAKLPAIQQAVNDLASKVGAPPLDVARLTEQVTASVVSTLASAASAASAAATPVASAASAAQPA